MASQVAQHYCITLICVLHVRIYVLCVNCKGVESLNGADKRTGLRAEWAADMLQFAVHLAAKWYSRRITSLSCTFVTIPPRVRDHMKNACKTPEDLVFVSWFDKISGIVTVGKKHISFLLRVPQRPFHGVHAAHQHWTNNPVYTSCRLRVRLELIQVH